MLDTKPKWKYLSDATNINSKSLLQIYFYVLEKTGYRIFDALYPDQILKHLVFFMISLLYMEIVFLALNSVDSEKTLLLWLLSK
jgi:hypothetical protein